MPGQPGAMQASAPSAMALRLGIPGCGGLAVLGNRRVHLAKLEQRLRQVAAGADGVRPQRHRTAQRLDRFAMRGP